MARTADDLSSCCLSPVTLETQGPRSVCASNRRKGGPPARFHPALTYNIDLSEFSQHLINSNPICKGVFDQVFAP
jgi:hypothetical protein